MTSMEVIELKKHLAILGAFYNKPLPDQVLLLYVKDLEILNFREVMIAMDELRKEKRFSVPLPFEIVEKIKPIVSPRSIADDLANRIIASFRRHGNSWTNGFFREGGNYYEAYIGGVTARFDSFQEAVTAEIGEVGWTAIHRMGGYTHSCREWEQSPTGTFRAQLRDMINSVLEQAKAGVLHKLPALPEGPIGQRLNANQHTPAQLEQSNKTQPQGLQKAEDILKNIKEPQR